MRKFLRLLLALVYNLTTVIVLIEQTEAAGEKLGTVRSSASPMQPHGDTHWASDPHFSHAKQTGSDIVFRSPVRLYFTITSARAFLYLKSSVSQTFEHPRPSRAPPIVF